MASTLGIVAMLDILGYKAFLRNTNASNASRIISNTLLSIPAEITKTLQSAVAAVKGLEFENTETDEKIQAHEEEMARVERLVFADTILMAKRLTPTPFPYTFLYEIMPFLAEVSLLCRRFFDQGLPLRGAVALGEFIVHGYCFAGDAIVKAYEEENRLDFAGCALEDESARAIIGAIEHCGSLQEVISPAYRRLLFSAEAPTKQGAEQMILLRWGDPFDDWGELPADLELYVEEAFRAHNKGIDGGVLTKLGNTQRLLAASRLKN